MSLQEQKFDKILTIPTEFFQEPELKALIKANEEGKKEVICYDGFEPSGRMHIAQGLLRTINTNKLTECGFTFIFWVADWFAQLNLKLDGDLKKIRKAGELMIEIWKACGMDMTRVKFLWASEEINKRPDKYWSTVMDISSKFNLQRVLRCTQIMGRSDSDSLAASQVFYPIMQCADIFFLNVDICSLGLDQRKVNTMALEYCDKIKRKFKPIILSHVMLRGLDGSDKMSKSNPDNAIFMDDEPADVKRKIRKAFCEPQNIEVNPVLEYYKHIVFNMEKEISIMVQISTSTSTNTSTSSTESSTSSTESSTEPIASTETIASTVPTESSKASIKSTASASSETQKAIIYASYAALEADFAIGTLHPADLKPDLTKRINIYLSPVHKHFAENKDAADLLKTVKKFQAKMTEPNKEISTK